MKSPITSLLILALGATTFFSGCNSAGTGAAIGSSAGFGIGALAGNSYRDAVAGAAIGAAAGALVGLAVEENRRDYYRNQAPDGGYPVARPTNRFGFVRSPYTNQIIDVRGMPSGSLARDPSAQGGPVFIVP